MSFDWPLSTLEDFVTLFTGFPFKSKQFSDIDGTKLLRGDNVAQGTLRWENAKRWTDENLVDKHKNYLLREKDVILAMDRPWIEAGLKFSQIESRDLPCYLVQRVACLRANDPDDQDFLKFIVGSRAFTEYVKLVQTGTAVPHISGKQILAFEFRLPPKDVRLSIGKTLSDIDKKISINTQTNQTLEQMAQAIFKSWFVDFDPVKAKMKGEQPEGMDDATASLFPEKLVSETGLPEGWKLSEIGDEVTVVGGGTPSKKNDDFWVDGHIHWTSPKDLSGVQDKVLLDTASKLTEAGLKKVSSGLLPVDTVLLSSRAPVGYLALAKVPMAINQGYIAMKCEKVLPPEFVLQWCVHRMDEIKQRASGSTFAEISKKSFKPISVVVPSEDILSAYRKVVKPLYDAITSNAQQNEQLASLRDTLLPKLLSGEIELAVDKVSK